MERVHNINENRNMIEMKMLQNTISVSTTLIYDYPYLPTHVSTLGLILVFRVYQLLFRKCLIHLYSS